MFLTSRISVQGSKHETPEDYLSSALGVIFPDDITIQHGDSDQSLVYTSPNLPKPLYFVLSDPFHETDRMLFSHHLWNSSLLLAELIEKGESCVDGLGKDARFSVKGQSCIELGAGTALPSITAALLGATLVSVTDYPSEVVLSVLKTNIQSNITPLNSPSSSVPQEVQVEGHQWGVFTDPFCVAQKHAYTRVMASDCLWMPWQHENLHRSIAYFLSNTDPEARAWVVAGFHTGKENLTAFFAEEKLESAGLRLERIWERNCIGEDRAWNAVMEEDSTARKRWSVIGIIKKREAIE